MNLNLSGLTTYTTPRDIIACPPGATNYPEFESGSPCDRTWRKQSKAEARLGLNWARPKGMHQATRERLMSIIWGCEGRRETALASYLDAMLQRHPSLRGDPLLRGED